MGLIHPLQPPIAMVLPGRFWDPLPFAVCPVYTPGGMKGHGAVLAPGALTLHRALIRLALKQEELLSLHPTSQGRADLYEPELRDQFHCQGGQLTRASSWLQRQRAGNNPRKGCVSSRPMHSAFAGLSGAFDTRAEPA